MSECIMTNPHPNLMKTMVLRPLLLSLFLLNLSPRESLKVERYFCSTSIGIWRNKTPTPLISITKSLYHAWILSSRHSWTLDMKIALLDRPAMDALARKPIPMVDLIHEYGRKSLGDAAFPQMSLSAYIVFHEKQLRLIIYDYRSYAEHPYEIRRIYRYIRRPFSWISLNNISCLYNHRHVQRHVGGPPHLSRCVTLSQVFSPPPACQLS